MASEISKEEVDENKRTNEMYKIWKKNAPAMYEYLFSRALAWPTLTAQWFPDIKSLPDSHMRETRFLIGTNTSGKDREYLMIGSLEVPKEEAKRKDLMNFETGEIGGPGQARKPFKYEITQKINHAGEVNKARYMPQNPDIIATLGVGGTCYIFDRTKHPNEAKDDEIHAQMKLTGHTDEGFGMSWSPNIEGLLATASQDKTVRIWNIKDGFSRENAQDFPAQTVITSHSDTVNDVKFHPKFSQLLATCSDDKTYQLHDLRKQGPIKTETAHSDAVNCLTWHPRPDLKTYEYMLLTGGADSKVCAFDVRTGRKLHVFENHEDSVISLEWSPVYYHQFSSASYDKTINIWDCTKIGEEQTTEDAVDGPPELYVYPYPSAM